MTLVRGVFFIILVLSCAGCGASLHTTCLNGDWYKIGKRDGTEGKSASHLFDKHAKACSIFKIALNKPAYLEGQRAGLKDYCSIGGMYGQGILGKPYRRACPKASESVLKLAYSWGRKASPVITQLTEVEDAIRDTSDQLYESSHKPKQEDRLNEEIERLEGEHARLEKELGRIQTLASKEVGQVNYRLQKNKGHLSRLPKQSGKGHR